MKKYLAIGHFKDSKNMTSVAMRKNNIKDFRCDLQGNGFIAYAIISEKKLHVLGVVDDMQLFEEVKKLSSNYRRWNDLTDYIEQCYDIMVERMANC